MKIKLCVLPRPFEEICCLVIKLSPTPKNYLFYCLKFKKKIVRDLLLDRRGKTTEDAFNNLCVHIAEQYPV
jgi:hypothetical protein